MVSPLTPKETDEEERLAEKSKGSRSKLQLLPIYIKQKNSSNFSRAPTRKSMKTVQGLESLMNRGCQYPWSKSESEEVMRARQAQVNGPTDGWTTKRDVTDSRVTKNREVVVVKVAEIQKS